jgi:N-acetyl-alpha-D-muramate 1-phosphate uridylyltransferase
MTRSVDQSPPMAWPIPVCILAGGFGTRLGQLAQDVPKALMPIGGRPFVFYQLQALADQGATYVVLCVGHMGELIEHEIGHERFGITIAYSHDGPGNDGTLGAIKRAASLLGPRFFYLYGDTVLQIDYPDVESAWRNSGRPGIMTVLRNLGQWGTSNADFHAGLVVGYEKEAPRPDMQWIDYGMGGLSTQALSLAPARTRDLAALHAALAAKGLLAGYEVTQRFYEIGTPDALAETTTFLTQRRLR